MNITQVCEGCGEEFIAKHGTILCSGCFKGHVKLHTSTARIPKQINERNRESKQREKSKRRAKYRHENKE